MDERELDKLVEDATAEGEAMPHSDLATHYGCAIASWHQCISDRDQAQWLADDAMTQLSNSQEEVLSLAAERDEVREALTELVAAWNSYASAPGPAPYPETRRMSLAARHAAALIPDTEDPKV